MKKFKKIKGQTRIAILEKLFLEHRVLTKKQIMDSLNVNYCMCRGLVGGLRHGTKVFKNGKQRRPAYNIQSISKSGNQQDRHYKLIDSTTKAWEEKEVLTRTQKIVSTYGKDTFTPTAKAFIKKVPITQAKKFLLEAQSAVIDSIMLEHQ